jgi:predicted Zn-dependent protease with MMP-like domain
MADEDQIDRQLEAGYGALEKGDLQAARKAAQAVIALDRMISEAHTLLGAVAEREGDLAAARKSYDSARAADPTAFEPALALAELEHADGQTARARKLFTEALEVAEEEEELVEATLAAAEFELAEGDVAAARARIEELPPVDLPEPNDHLRAGDLMRQIAAASTGDAVHTALAEAQRHFEAAKGHAGGDASLLADALYGLALVAEAHADEAEKKKRFAEVLALDVKEARPAFALSEDRMEELVDEVLEELPERARTLLGNVPIVVEERPTEGEVADGLDPRLLGLFAGTPHAQAGDVPTLSQITLYARNLERAATSLEDLEEEIRVTLLHETGHFFGLDEEQLADLGLD